MNDLFQNINEIFRDAFGHDISRGKANEESKEAFKKVDKQKQQQKVFELINGERSTLDIARLLQTDLHKISGRFTELKIQNKIKKVNSKENHSVYEKI